MPISNSSIIIAVKPEGKCRSIFHVAAMLLYILQKESLNKICLFF